MAEEAVSISHCCVNNNLNTQRYFASDTFSVFPFFSDGSVIDIIVQFAEGQCLAIHASLRGF